MRKHIPGLILLLPLTSLVAGCNSDSQVRVTHDKPVTAAAVVTPRSEPIFYNGKTYHLDFSPRGPGVYEMAVSGMSPRQQKDAEAVATSSLAYFACPDGQRGQLATSPAYEGAKWRMQAKCG